MRNFRSESGKRVQMLTKTMAFHRLLKLGLACELVGDGKASCLSPRLGPQRRRSQAPEQPVYRETHIFVNG
jgi:hypothetical protein